MDYIISAFGLFYFWNVLENHIFHLRVFAQGRRHLFLNFEHEIGHRNIHRQHRACDCPECCQSARQIRIVFKIIIALRLAL